MEKQNAPVAICKNVFKSGESIPTENEFTKKWIELIIVLEKGRSVDFCGKP